MPQTPSETVRGQERIAKAGAAHPQAEKKEVAMPVRNAVHALPDSYFELVRQFPLTRIRDGAHVDAAQQKIDLLLEQDLDEGAQEYLDALTDLVETYEDAHYPIPDASEADVLRELMRSNKLSQARLAKLAGISQSTISAVLNRNRSLTKAQVVALAKLFGISPSAFLRG
jgi:HTH-type transcriptional regulator/antitoxin HigA